MELTLTLRGECSPDVPCSVWCCYIAHPIEPQVAGTVYYGTHGKMVTTVTPSGAVSVTSYRYCDVHRGV